MRFSTLASLFFTMLLDSGLIALPIEVILAGYVVSNPAAAWALVLLATAGAVCGNFIPYRIGRFAGHMVLRRCPNPPVCDCSGAGDALLFLTAAIFQNHAVSEKVAADLWIQ